MSEQLRFDGQTVVVTGAGNGLGKAYALFFASRGANLVINDLGGSINGDGSGGSKMADEVVNEIKSAGGKAVANYDSVEFGDRIIDTAIKAFGRIDVLVNNAGILRDISFKNMKDPDWDIIMKVHVIGTYRTSRAAFPHMRKQKYGRIINTTSAAGLFGQFGQSNYSAAKLAIVGFTETLAKEGAKYNILANALAPIAGSRLTATVMSPELLEKLRPEWVTPVVAYLGHSSNTAETGGIFEVGGGHVAKLRWQRSKGALLRADDSFTPGALLQKWNEVGDFSVHEYPDGPADFGTLLEEAQKLPPNPKAQDIGLQGKVALITGAGNGLGRIYALQFAKYGAKVVVNDFVDPQPVVQEIQKLGGEAVGVKADVQDGDAVVKGAIDAFGRVDILVNNAGILRDKAFHNMDDSQFFQVLDVHLRGTYKVTKAAWPYMLKQKYGRIINTTSTSGIYGNFGQANYSAAKCGILGFGRTLAFEGQKNNIFVNTIAPNAGTNMTRTVMTEEMVQAFRPDYVAPLVLLLSSDQVPKPATGRLFEVGSGWVGETRWQRSGGVGFPGDVKLEPEHVVKAWPKIVNFDDGRADHPSKAQDATAKAMMNLMGGAKAAGKGAGKGGDKKVDYLKNIEEAKKLKGEGTPYTYTDKDVILYNLGLGAKRTDLKYVFEGADDFQVIPTFGVIPPFNAKASYDLTSLVPNFNPMMLLHGEQFLEIGQFPIPTAAELISYPALVEVQDKGKSGVITTSSTTKHAKTGKTVFYNESTLFIRGAGNFGGAAKGTDRGAATRVYAMPKRAPDAVKEEKTSDDQAALYRLSGDRNPLHIDPEFSKVGGFPVPILHGLCFFGISGKAILETYGQFKNIKVRFAGTVLPGQTLVTEMWKEGNTIIFQSKVKETGKLAIAGAGAELLDGGKSKL